MLAPSTYQQQAAEGVLLLEVRSEQRWAAHTIIYPAYFEKNLLETFQKFEII